MNTCPHCQRKLLSHTSAKCNWCGETIGDANYQTRADANREAFFNHQAQHDAQSLAAYDAININVYDPYLDPLTSTPIYGPRSRGTAARHLRYHTQQDLQIALERASAGNPLNNPEKCEDGPPEQAPEDAQRHRFEHLEF